MPIHLSVPRSSKLARSVALVTAAGVGISLLSAPPVFAVPAPAVAQVASPAVPTADELSAPDLISAQIEARARGERIEALSERAEDSTTWANPDGTFTTDDTEGPIRIKDEAESSGWRELDYDLEFKNDGTVGPKSGYVELTLSGEATASEASANGLVSAVTDRGKTIAFGWDEALPEPVLDGETATYENVREGVDLVVTLTATGFEQFFVLNERPANVTDLDLSLPLDAGNLDANELQNGSIEITDSNDRQAAFIPTPYMWDSSQGAISGLNENRTELEMELKTRSGDEELVLTPDADFLSDPSTEYPVIIDPSLTLDSKYDTYVRSDFPSTHYNTDDELQIGTYDGGSSKARTTIDFLSTAWKGTEIVSAGLKLYLFHSYSCTKSDIKVYRSAKAYSETDWGNQPFINTDYQTTYSAAKGYSSACAAGYITIPVTEITQSLAGNEETTVAFGLRASESSNTGWKRFRSGDATSGNPTLSVTYNRYPSTPSKPTFESYYNQDNLAYTGTLTPTLSTISKDADGGTVRTRFDVSTTSSFTSIAGSCVSPYVASGATASCKIASGVLAANTVYFIRARAQDGSLLSKAYSSFTSMRTSTAVPQAASLSCESPYGDGSWTSTIPSTEPSCTVSVPSATGFSAATLLTVQYDGATFRQSIAMNSSFTSSFNVPRTAGSHTLIATTYSASGKTKATSYSFGLGAPSITSPVAGTKTVDFVRVSASAPPRNSASASASLRWRPANSDSSAWNSGPSIPIAAGSSTAITRIADFRWSTLDAAVDTSTGESIELDSRKPLLLEIDVCFTYTPGGVKCASDSTPPVTVFRAPEANASGAPMAAAGEGAVSLWTGELSLSATDVLVTTPDGSLTIGREHSSFAGTPNSVTEVFGPGWTPSFGTPSSPTAYSIADQTAIDGTISLTSSNDDNFVFRHNAGKVASSPIGKYLPVDTETKTSAARLEITGSLAARTLIFTDAEGTVFSWKPVASTAARLIWTPVAVAQPGIAGVTTYTTDSQGRVTRILAPVPDGVTCPATGTLSAGCSALTLSYASSTSATSAAFGDFTGRVSSISYTAFDPSVAPSGAMSTATLADYKYDSTGKLREVRNTSDPAVPLQKSYEYQTANSNVLITRSQTGAEAPTYYNYDTTPTVRLKNVELGGAVAGQPNQVDSSFVYGISPSASGLPSMTASNVSVWGQTNIPTSVFAVFNSDHPVGSSSPSALTSSDLRHATLYYVDDYGFTTNSVMFGAGAWQIDATILDDQTELLTELSAKDTAAARAGEEFSLSDHASVERYNAVVPDASDPSSPLVEAGTYLLDQWSEPRSAILQDGSSRVVRVHTRYEYDNGAPNGGIDPVTGEPYLLVTKSTVGLAEVESYSTNPSTQLSPDLETTSVTVYGYDPIDGASVTGATSGWTLGAPTLVTTKMASSAADITTKVRYNSNGRVVESRAPGAGATSASTKKTIFYSAGSNSGDALCGNKPQWAGLPCWSGPTAEPNSGPDVTDLRVAAYDKWLAPKQTIETSGSGGSMASRTSAFTYTAGGKFLSKAVATSGVANSEPVGTTSANWSTDGQNLTGLKRLGANGVTLDELKWEYDKWGRVVKSTDAFGSVTTTSYVPAGEPGAGAVASEANYIGTKTYSYDGLDADGLEEHRGLATSISFTDLGAFAASYDANGSLTKQTMPGGIEQDITRDSAGNILSSIYSGASASGASAPWASFGRSYDGLGRVVSEDLPGGSAGDGSSDKAYTYDAGGRLSTVTDSATDASGDTLCVKRTYGFSITGNRTSLNTVKDTEACSSAGTTTTYSYDAESRQNSSSLGTSTYVYDQLGRQTSLPGSDTPNGGSGSVNVTYFDTDAVASIASGSSSTEFSIDALGRRVAEVRTGVDAAELETHFASSNDMPSWIKSNDDLFSYRTTFDGLGAVTQDGHGSVLALKGIDGNIVSWIPVPASGDAMETGAFASFTEYGVASADNSAEPLGYAWNGASQRQTDASTGLNLLGSRLYNPSTGRFTSTDQVAGGNENAYNYPNNPTVSSDLDGYKSITKKTKWYNVSSFEKVKGTSCKGKSGYKASIRGIKRTYTNKKDEDFGVDIRSHVYLSSCQISDAISTMKSVIKVAFATVGAALGGLVGFLVAKIGGAAIIGSSLALVMAGIGQIVGEIAGWVVGWCAQAGVGIHVWAIASAGIRKSLNSGCEGQGK